MVSLRRLNENNIASFGKAGQIAKASIEAAGGGSYLKTLLNIANEEASARFNNLTAEQKVELENILRNDAGKAPKYPTTNFTRLVKDKKDSRSNNSGRSL